jgi:hypothetical protein
MQLLKLLTILNAMVTQTGVDRVPSPTHVDVAPPSVSAPPNASKVRRNRNNESKSSDDNFRHELCCAWVN